MFLQRYVKKLYYPNNIVKNYSPFQYYFVTLTSPKVLSLDNKDKKMFLYFVLSSLIRNFVPKLIKERQK